MDDEIAPELLERAYREGFFPMADATGAIGWYWPDPRAIIPLDRFHVSRRLARMVRQHRFEIVFDRDFEGVMRACADRPETWISAAIIRAFVALHRRGQAHSIEAYRDGRLAGGIYGVSLGGAFMGESMFARAPNASSVCMTHLVRRLRERGFTLFDIQYLTPHLTRFGAVEIPRADYLHRLRRALRLERRLA